MKVNKLAQIFMFFAIFICSLLAIIFLVTNHIMLFLMAFGSDFKFANEHTPIPVHDLLVS